MMVQLSIFEQEQEQDSDANGTLTLPDGWTWATVGELGEIDEQAVLTGPFGSNLGREDFAKSGVPVLTIGCLTETGLTLDKAFFISEDKARTLSQYRVRKGDLLFSRMASVGRADIVPARFEGAVINYHLMRLRLASEIVKPEYFIVWVRGSRVVTDYIKAVNHGATRDGINTKQLLALPVLLAPRLEQERIVAEIEQQFTRLDAAVAALKRAQANLKRYKAAVLKAAFEGALVPQDASDEPAALLARILAARRAKWEADLRAKGKNPTTARYDEPAAPNTDDLPALPDGWVWASVEQVGNVQLGRQRSPQNRSRNHPTKYIRAANITERGLDLTDVLDMEFLPHEKEIYRLMKGDIILSEASGSPDQVGKPALWNDETGEYCFQNTVIRLRPYGFDSRFLFLLFQHFYVNGIFAQIAGGVGINHLSAGKFARIPIPVAPENERQRIIAEVERRLSVVQEQEAVIAHNLIRAERLRQAILAQAFAGRLVPQDPTDEPASVLLARIRAERLAHDRNARPSRRVRQSTAAPMPDAVRDRRKQC